MLLLKKSWIIVLIFFITTVAFNATLVRELISSATDQSIFVSDATLTEYLSENGYQKIIHNKNPFIINDSILYPFQINTTLNDPNTGHVPYFILLRLFFSSYVTTGLIVLINFMFGCIFMFLLLRKLKVNTPVAVIISLSFAFTPFMSYRVLGHYSYTAHFLFPLTYFIAFSLITSSNLRQRLMSMVLLGLVIGWALLINPYYFFSILLSAIFVGAYYLIIAKNKVFNIFKLLWKYFIGTGIVTFIFLYPWIINVYKIIVFAETSKKVHLGSSIILSADVLNFFVPSYYNPVYQYIFLKLIGTLPHTVRFIKFYTDNWNDFAYPGAIYFISGIIMIISWKNLSYRFKSMIVPLVFTSLFFAILTLGPFLKIMNRWVIDLDGVGVLIPLPYLILRFVPILNGLRAPMRFTPIYVFFGLLASGIILNYFYEKLNRKKRILFLASFILIFLIDQIYIIPTKQDQIIPSKIYSYIKKDADKVTVLEIPFTVRDGFKYLGFVHAVSIIKGALIHEKPTMGGYLPRVQDYIFSYYQNLPFLGHIASIIDKGNYDPMFEKPKEPKVTKFLGDLADVEKEIEFFDIKYILLKRDEKYSEQMKNILTGVGFRNIQDEHEYQLYERPLEHYKFNSITFDGKSDRLFIVEGISDGKKGKRRIIEKQARIFIKTVSTNRRVIIEAQAIDSKQDVKVYMDKTYVDTLSIGTNKHSYPLLLDEAKAGIHELLFQFKKTDPNILLFTIRVQ